MADEVAGLRAQREIAGVGAGIADLVALRDRFAAVAVVVEDLSIHPQAGVVGHEVQRLRFGHAHERTRFVAARVEQLGRELPSQEFLEQVRVAVAQRQLGVRELPARGPGGLDRLLPQRVEPGLLFLVEPVRRAAREHVGGAHDVRSADGVLVEDQHPLGRRRVLLKGLGQPLRAARLVADQHAVLLPCLGREAEHAVAEARLDVQRPDPVRIVRRIVCPAEVPRAQRRLVAAAARVGRQQRESGLSPHEFIPPPQHANGELVVAAPLDRQNDLLDEPLAGLRDELLRADHARPAIVIGRRRLEHHRAALADVVQPDVERRRLRLVEHVPRLVAGHFQLDGRSHERHGKDVYAAGSAQRTDLEPARIGPADGQAQLLGELDVEGPLVAEVLGNRLAQRHAHQEHVAGLGGDHRRACRTALAVQARHFGRKVVQRRAARPGQRPDPDADAAGQRGVLVGRREQVHGRVVGHRDLEDRPARISRRLGPLVVRGVVAARVFLPVRPLGRLEEEVVRAVPVRQIQRHAADGHVFVAEGDPRAIAGVAVDAHGHVQPRRGDLPLARLNEIGRRGRPSRSQTQQSSRQARLHGVYPSSERGRHRR